MVVDAARGEGGSRSRIEVMPAALADQIAAGEVVERPASIVKELVENAVDAGARRVEVELVKAGVERIVVLDDGAGLHPEDLALALTRHATSKVRSASDLVEIETLGFRGEALASIAAVADVTMETRRASDDTGTRMRARPGLAPELSVVGRPVGTRVEVASLFVNVPARRKFLRSEATEVGHCSDTMVRLALSHPGVHMRLRHGGRTLLDLPAASLPDRIEQVLTRRVRTTIVRAQGVVDGVEVEAFLAPPTEGRGTVRGRGHTFVVVRRRVVRERSLTSAISKAYGDLLPAGHGPVGCLLIDPPAGAVDVNVHPQKTEVRFSDPQRVYAAARQILAKARLAFDGPARVGVDMSLGGMSPPREEPASRAFTAGAQAALQRSVASPPAVAQRWGGGASDGAGTSYRLRTSAAASDAASRRADAAAATASLRSAAAAARRLDDGAALDPAPILPPSAEAQPELSLLTCLPGPIALLRFKDQVLAVDLRRLRSHLVYERLVAELGGGAVGSQGLLSPVVVKRAPADVELALARKASLADLGIVLEAFGTDALLVRGVPAHLKDCVEAPDVHDLIEKVVAWLRVEDSARDEQTHAMLAAVSSTRGADPAPRLARRWVRELLEQDRDLARIPGIRCLAPEDFLA